MANAHEHTKELWHGVVISLIILSVIPINFFKNSVS